MKHRKPIECDIIEKKHDKSNSKDGRVVLYRRKIKMAETKPTNLPRIENRDLEHAAHLRFCKNGDGNFSSHPITWNKKRIRTFDSFLTELTNKLKLTGGCVRRVYTPQNGHLITDFEKLQEGGLYVAAGTEAFRSLKYAEIEDTSRIKHHKINNNYYVEPVTHSKLRRSGKIKHMKNEGKIIKIWPNGDDIHEPRTVLLTSWMQKDFDVIKDAINERISLQINGPVAKLYCTDGRRIQFPDEIEHGGHYVACRYQERLRKVDYREHGAKNLTTTPRLDSKLLPPLSRSTNKSSKFSSPDHSNPTSSYASEKSNNTYTSRYRRNKVRKEEDGVFHAKPVAHKRGSSERNKRVDYDKDEGGVFKAKGENRTTNGAREIEDTNDTQVDVPVEQREAEIVNEEDGNTQNKSNNNRSNNNKRVVPPINRKNQRKVSEKTGKSNNVSNGNRSNPPDSPKQQDDNVSNSQQDAAIKIQSQFRGYQTRKQLTEDGQFANQQNGYVSRSPTPPTQPKTKPTRNHNNVRQNPSKPVTKATRHTPKTTQDKKNDAPPPRNGPKKTEKNTKTSEKKNGRPKSELNEKQVQAATKIQAGYRGYKTRRSLNEKKEANNSRQPSMSEEDAVTKIQASFRGRKVREELKETKNEVVKKASEAEKSYSDKEEVAAVKIQAGFRGYKTRKDLAEKESEDFYTEEEHNAAAKIQSGFRGFKARKDLVSQKASEYETNENRSEKNDDTSEQNNSDENAENQIDDSNKEYSDEHHKAAIKIQSNMRGVLARKEFARRQAQQLYQSTEESAVSNIGQLNS